MLKAECEIVLYQKSVDMAASICRRLHGNGKEFDTEALRILQSAIRENIGILVSEHTEDLTNVDIRSADIQGYLNEKLSKKMANVFERDSKEFTVTLNNKHPVLPIFNVKKYLLVLRA